MRKSKTVKIDLDNGKSKEFTIKELSIKDILELSQNNQFFKSQDDTTKKVQNGKEPAKPEASKGFIEEIKEYSKEIGQVMEKTCDFKLQDIKDNDLAPSEIRLLWESFKEVNQDFLDVLEKLKILEFLQKMLERHINSFSKILAIL